MKSTVFRLAPAVLIVSSLLLSGCSSATALSNDAAVETSASVQLPDGTVNLPAGYISTEIGVDLTSTATVHPKDGKIIDPSGELTLTEVKSLDWISPTQISADPPPLPEDSQYVQALAPAEGEKLYAVSLSFMPAGVDDAPDTEVSISVGGVQKHLYTFGKVPAFGQAATESKRLLVAIPEGADAKLVAAAGSHEQYLALPAGERVADEVAAAYYLPTTRQEPMHSFTYKKQSFTDGDGGSSAVLFDAQVDAVELTAWSPEDGWAAPGQAWLAVDWGVNPEFEDSWWRFGNSKASLKVAVDGVEASDKLSWSDYVGSGPSAKSFFQVPIATRQVSLSVEASVKVTNWGKKFSKDLSFSSEKLEVSFPEE